VPKRLRAARHVGFFCFLLPRAATRQELAMRWVTLLSMENVEHTIKMDAVVQVVAQSGGVRMVQLTNGEKLLISAQEWTTKMHEQIQRSRGIS